MKPIDNQRSLEGRRFRFVVSSAEEAVRLIRQHLGPEAEVLSVNQLEGKGLMRFLTTPRLEVVAMVPRQDASPAAPAPDENLFGTAPGGQKPSTPKPRDEAGPAHQQNRPAQQPVFNAEASLDDLEDPRDELSRPTPTEHNEQRPGYPRGRPSAFTGETDDDTDPYVGARARLAGHAIKAAPLAAFLRKAGFDESLINRFENAPDWREISNLPRDRALGELCQWLTAEYHLVARRPLTARVAFIGTAGSGRTTAVCKFLSRRIFFDKAPPPAVLMLDGDAPASVDALAAFCDVMNLQLLRETGAAPENSSPLCLDTPALAEDEPAALDRLKLQLDELRVESRVMVVNAAYSPTQIKQALALGRRAGATHLAFSHVDEIGNATALWQFILRSGLPTLFLGSGRNIAGDYNDDILGHMLGATFPDNLVSANRPAKTSRPAPTTNVTTHA